MARFEYEKLAVGDEIPLGPYTVTREELIEFAEEFDPAPFHLDDEKAGGSLLGGLATSGWHNCSILMRMMCDAYILDSTSLGSPGIKYCNWRKPVNPNDTLTGSSRILSKRKSVSLPNVGLVDLRHEVFNQRGDLVMELENTGFFRLSQ